MQYITFIDLESRLLHEVGFGIFRLLSFLCCKQLQCNTGDDKHFSRFLNQEYEIGSILLFTNGN